MTKESFLSLQKISFYSEKATTLLTEFLKISTCLSRQWCLAQTILKRKKQNSDSTWWKHPDKFYEFELLVFRNVTNFIQLKDFPTKQMYKQKNKQTNIFFSMQKRSWLFRLLAYLRLGMWLGHKPHNVSLSTLRFLQCQCGIRLLWAGNGLLDVDSSTTARNLIIVEGFKQ